MPYGWKIEHNGADISDKIVGFTINDSMDSYCREMILQIQDVAFYNALDFSTISEAPEIKIFTKTETAYVSQGKFFIERPEFTVSITADAVRSVWGRSEVARLGEPFAPRISQSWEADTSFFEICEALCTRCGLTWNAQYCEIDDFVIYAYTYDAERLYPIEIITELADFAGATVGTDAAGHLCIRQIQYTPTTETLTLTDADIQEISESPEWPAFGNRIRITPGSAGLGYAVTLEAETQCLSDDGSSTVRLYAAVTDADGNPVDGIPVQWSTTATHAALTTDVSNTGQVVIPNEVLRATNFHQVELAFAPSEVHGLYAFADYNRMDSLIAGGGFTIQGRMILLDAPLQYCDQKLRAWYEADGIAVNTVTAGSYPEDITVTASIDGGESAQCELYIGNPCKCPPTIEVSANPSSVLVNTETAGVLIYAEEGGPVTTGRKVYLREGSAVKKGELRWDVARLGTVAVSGEKLTAVNEGGGNSQCELSMYPASVSSVHQMDENGNATGDNLYALHNGKTVTLNTMVATGTDLIADYTAQGAALNGFLGNKLGEALLNATMESTTEQPIEAYTTVTVTDENNSTDDSSLVDGGVGGLGGRTWTVEDHDPEWDPSPSEREPSDFPKGTMPCATADISNDVSGAAQRFPTDRDDCNCEDYCRWELDTMGTFQGYDNGSYRTIDQIVVEDDGIERDTPEYYEQMAVRTDEARQQCINECSECEDVANMAFSGPDTINPSDAVAVSVSGGKGPYSWSVSGTGFSLESDSTDTGGNMLIASADACGSATISVEDACNNTSAGYVRCTAGQWVRRADLDYACTIDNVANPQGCEESAMYGGYVYDAVQKNRRYEYKNNCAFVTDFSCPLMEGASCVPDPDCHRPDPNWPTPEHQYHLWTATIREWRWEC